VKPRSQLVRRERVVEVVDADAAHCTKKKPHLFTNRYDHPVVIGHQRSSMDNAITTIELIRVQPVCGCFYPQGTRHFGFGAKGTERDLHVCGFAAEQHAIYVYELEF